MFDLLLRLGDACLRQRLPRLFPEFMGIYAHRADNVALSTGRTLIEPFEELFLLFLVKTGFHNPLQRAQLSPGTDTFTRVLRIGRAPDKALAAPGAGLDLYELPPGESGCYFVGRYCFVFGQYMSSLPCSSDAFSAMTRGARRLWSSLLWGR